jgi:hypothetical protein
MRSKRKTGHPFSRMPRFVSLRGFRFEAWIGSAHELLWNFLPASWRAEFTLRHTRFVHLYGRTPLKSRKKLS